MKPSCLLALIFVSALVHISADVAAQTASNKTSGSLDWKFEGSSLQIPDPLKERLSILDFKISQSFSEVDAILKQRPFQMVRRINSVDDAASLTVVDSGTQFKVSRPRFVSDVIANDLIEERSDAEGIRIFFTSPSNGRKVFALVREVSYVRDPTNPTLDSMLAAAERKWGTEPVSFQGYSSSKYLWFYDKSGSLIDNYLAEKRCREGQYQLAEPLSRTYQLTYADPDSLHALRIAVSLYCLA